MKQCNLVVLFITSLKVVFRRLVSTSTLYVSLRGSRGSQLGFMTINGPPHKTGGSRGAHGRGRNRKGQCPVGLSGTSASPETSLVFMTCSPSSGY